MKKKNIQRTLIALSLGTIILSFFSGCGENSDKTESGEYATTEIFSSVPTESVSSVTSENESAQDSNSQSTDLAIGETVTLGRYEQDNDTANGAEPIEWQVADIQDDRILLISKYVLDNIRYNEYAGIYGNRDSESVPWAQSYIYSWLNEDFANSAFTEDERKRIIDTTAYSDTDSSGRKEIIGSVFLLSYEEAVKYFGLETATATDYNDDEYELCFSDKALCQPTPYALEELIDSDEFTPEDADKMLELGLECDSSVVGNTYADYWLRSSYNCNSWFTAEGHAIRINPKGSFEIGYVSLADVKTARNGVRPCVWVTLGEVDEVSETIESATEAIEAEGAYGNAELIDLSFLSSNPNKIELITRIYNVVKRDTGQVELFEADIDIIDTGVSYLLGTSKIKYNLSVSQKAYNDFINNAVDFDGEVQKGNRGGKDLYQYDLIDGSCEFKCYNETFDLIRYYLDDNGRSTAEFVGEDGEYYYIYNDMSPCLDDFTEELYYNIKTLSSEDAYREITYNENSYIEISYDKGKQLGIDAYLTKSPDFNSGNPGGMYCLDIDDNGNFAKIVNPFV